MRRYVLILALILIAVPAFAQVNQESEELLRQLGMGALFADGNLALREIQRGNHPVEQLKRFFAQAKLPMSSAQEKQLNAIVDAQIQALEAAAQDEGAIRRSNVEYSRKSNEVFTVEQRAELRRYRTEQIMMGGGFPALRLVLENAQTPLSPDQEKQAALLYTDFNRQVNQMARDAKGAPNRTELDKLENDALGKVIRLLTPEQRKSLAASRQGGITAKIRP